MASSFVSDEESLEKNYSSSHQARREVISGALDGGAVAALAAATAVIIPRSALSTDADTVTRVVVISGTAAPLPRRGAIACELLEDGAPKNDFSPHASGGLHQFPIISPPSRGR